MSASGPRRSLYLTAEVTQKILETDIRKAIGPDEFSNWILRDLVDIIADLIVLHIFSTNQYNKVEYI